MPNHHHVEVDRLMVIFLPYSVFGAVLVALYPNRTFWVGVFGFVAEVFIFESSVANTAVLAIQVFGF